MVTHEHASQQQTAALLEILRERRSRRFGWGMRMEQGPLAYQSQEHPLPLTEEEEALLVFAACGVTGYALADLRYDRGQGGTIMSGLLGRTIPSGDALQTVAMIVANEEATYFIKRPQDYAREEIPELVSLAQAGDYQELYRRSRVQIAEGRPTPAVEPMVNLDVNRWSLYAPGSTYFLPVNEFTQMYINGVLEIFGESTGAFIVDERAGFLPAGVGKFGRSKGGHLNDDPKAERTFTIQILETLVTEFVTVEQGMLLQNIALMTQALGLGGFPHWAAHPYGWFEALGFRLTPLPSTRYLGANRLLSFLARLLKRETTIPLVQGLEHDGKPLLAPFCPPYYPNMEAAVRAVVERKFGPQGIFREGVRPSAWQEPETIAQTAAPPSDAAIEATIAYCEYIYQRYGRFPAYAPPLRTLLGFQVTHVDTAFYDQYYRPEALSINQREHLACWHLGARPRHRENSTP